MASPQSMDEQQAPDYGYQPDTTRNGWGASTTVHKSMPEFSQTATTPKQDTLFDYTGGSLLTPWTKTFDSSKYGGGGGGYTPMPSFSFGSFNPGSFSADQFDVPDDFSYAPGNFQGDRFTSPGQFQGGPALTVDRYSSGGDFANPNGAYEAERYSQERFADRPDFVAPDYAQAMNDPGYQFRLKQGLDAMQNTAAARGLLRSGATVKGLSDYAADSASQEYDKVYGRRFGEYQSDNENDRAAFLANQSERMGAYDRNNAANRDESLINYEQAAGTFDRNQAKKLAEYDRNSQAGILENQTAYNRGASEYDRNYGNAASEYDRKYAQDTSEYDRNYKNAFDTYNANYGNKLNAFQANTGAALGGASLNYQMQSGAWDRNYQNALQQYQINASNAANANSASSSAANQDYQRALADYNREYGIFRDNQAWQYGVLSDQQAADERALGREYQYGQNYAGAGAQNAYDYGNAAASGYVGSANAWNQGIGGAANSAMNAYGYYQANRPPTSGGG